MPSGRSVVLIVDDSFEDLATYSRWLLACADRPITVITASSLFSALETYEVYRPDCIVLDYDLGDSTGLEFMVELAKRGYIVPIVAITGNGNEAIAVEFMKAGARDYLTKSAISADELCSAVIAQLSPHTMRQQLALYRQRERLINTELATALGRSSFLAESGKLLAASLSYNELIGLAAKHAVPFLGETCFVDVFEDGVLHRRWIHTEGDSGLRSTHSQITMGALALDRLTGVAQAIRGQVPLYVSGNALSDAALDDAGIAVLLGAGVNAAAFLPLRSAGVTLGVLTIGVSRSEKFSDVERSLLEDYAQRVAVAIANARIVEAERLARERAEAAKSRLTFQSRISTLLAQSLDWEKALRKLMKLVTRSFCDTSAIFTVEGTSQRIVFVAAASHDKELEEAIGRHYVAFPPLLSDRVGIGRVVRTGRSQFFSTDVFPYSRDVFVNQRQVELIATWAPVSVISVPLQVKGVEVGVLMLVRDKSQKPFTIEDVAIAEDVARRTAVYMEIARLYEREHRIASRLQQALLPAELPLVSDVLFGVRYFAGAEGMDIGGDWYDIIEVGATLVITIGDVIGRGVEAAVAMGRYRDTLRAYAFEGYGAASALTRLNDLVHAVRGEAFATCTIVVLDRATRRIEYASAGHPPPMLRLADGTIRVLDAASSMPIGAWPATSYNAKKLEMPIGSTLVLYTDGLVETRKRSASDGVHVLRDALSRSPFEIELMLDTLLREVAPDRSDDIAILAVEMLPVESKVLKRWAVRRIDPSIMRSIMSEFNQMLEAGATSDSNMYGARLILGELLSNVVRHAPGPFRLELDWSSEFPVLHLNDSGPGFAVRDTFAAPEDILSVSGRGLFLVSAVSRSLTVTARPSGGLSTRVELPVRRKLVEREPALH